MNQHEITCPYCDAENEHDGDGDGIFINGWDYDIHCCKCGKKFWFRTYVKITFETRLERLGEATK